MQPQPGPSTQKEDAENISTVPRESSLRTYRLPSKSKKSTSKHKGKNKKTKHAADESYPSLFAKWRKGKTPAEDEYDPYQHRVKDGKTSSNFEALINLVKGSMGIGVMAMPYAFTIPGYALGLAFVIVTCIFCLYGMHTLIRCQYSLCRRNKVPYLNYSESMEEALKIGPHFMQKFAKSAKFVVNIFLLVLQLGICTGYFLFVGLNIQNVIAGSMGPNAYFPVGYVIPPLIVPFALISLISNIRILVPFSIQGNFFTFIAFAIVLFHIFDQLPPISTREICKVTWRFPIFIGLTMYALESTGVMLSVEKYMETPQNFTKPFGILNISMVLLLIVFVIVGFFGFWKYGDDVKGSVTLNIPANNEEHVVAKLFYALAIFISYPLQMHSAIEILWNIYIESMLEKRKKMHYRKLWEMLLRVFAVIATALLALACPWMSIITSLFGSTCLCFLGLVLPCTMDICCNWHRGAKNIKFILCRNLLLIIFGVFFMVTGTLATIADLIINKYLNEDVD